jgi:LCP family protein required for cell wall assembly
VAVGIAITLVALQSLAPSTALTSPSPASSLPQPATSAPESPSPTPAPGTPAPTATPDPLLGLDGRFTILLLGSDYRPIHPGNRTDAIMVVSINAVDGSVSAVSIPRDTARFPMPDGTVFKPRVNTLYQATINRVGRDAAGAEIRRILGLALGVEIDAYAVIGMYGLVELVDAVGGVDVYLDRAVRDPYYWVNNHTQGVYFPAGRNHLNGERALIFARTRKGDSDFQRARRQQQLVVATAQKVLKRGLDALPRLLKLATRWIQTDLPVSQAPALYALVASAHLDHARQAVLGPKYADPIAGTFTYQLRIDVVRALVSKWFAPAAGSPLATTEPPSPSPPAS